MGWVRFSCITVSNVGGVLTTPVHESDQMTGRQHLPVAEDQATSIPAGRAGFQGGALRAGRRALNLGLTPSLLPILGVYTLISLVIHPALGDELSYLGFARHITDGYYAQQGPPYVAGAYLWHGPGLPVLLAPLVALHVPVTLTRVLFGPVMLFAAMVVFHRLVRLYLSERGAVIATYALALYLPFFQVIGAIRVEPLSTLCFTLAAFFMVRAYRGGRRDAIWAGVALALLALSRVEYGYVLLAALVLSGVWLLRRRRSTAARQSTLALVVALLLCTPWLIYTYSVTKKPFYWGNSGGLSLYWMTAPGNLGDWHAPGLAFTTPALASSRPVFNGLHLISPPAQDAKLRHLALENIKHHPKHYLTNVVNNIGRLVFNSPYSFTNEKASLMFYALPNGLLISLLAIAAFLAIRVRRRIGPEILPIAAFAVLGFAVHVPVASYARFVVPQVPVAIWLAIAIIAPNVRLTPDPADPAPPARV